MFFSNLASSLRMPVVRSANRFDACEGFIQSAEYQKPLSTRIKIADSRILDERGLSAGEVAHRTIANPTAAGFDVHVFCYAKLGCRILDVFLIILRSPSDPQRIHKLPAVV